MDIKKFHAHLDELYTNKKSRNFVNHLIRAYFPIGNVQKVWEGPKRGFICALTNKPLISANDLINNVSNEENRKDFLDYLYAELNDENHNIQHPIEKAMGGKELALVGKETSTYLSHPAYREFYNWLVNKLLSGDKHINWLIKNMRSESMVNSINIEDQSEDVKKVVKRLKKSVKPTKKATLGDLDILQKLKAKMDDEG